MTNFCFEFWKNSLSIIIIMKWKLWWLENRPIEHKIARNLHVNYEKLWLEFQLFWLVGEILSILILWFWEMSVTCSALFFSSISAVFILTKFKQRKGTCSIHEISAKLSQFKFLYISEIENKNVNRSEKLIFTWNFSNSRIVSL